MNSGVTSSISCGIKVLCALGSNGWSDASVGIEYLDDKWSGPVTTLLLIV